MYTGPTIIKEDLVLHLDAANTKSYVSGSATWYDLSGNNNNGTLVSGSAFSSANGGSIVFDGVDDYISISQNINPPNITLEFFYKASVSSPYEYLISNTRDCCGPYNGYELHIVNGVPRFSIWNSTQLGLNGTSTLTNQIYHITATYDGSQMKIYQNSILTGLVNSALGIGSSPSFNLAIGGMGLNPAFYNLTGNIYIGRVYNRALTATEISQNFNATKGRFGL